jgi:demethylmenaquinone methyltransferase/2-methoxy-6-polyprenyl-1,4-benzoquinol methylase
MSEAVRQLFSSIAKRYDVANNAISFGLHKGWKKMLVDCKQVQPGSHVLDCATGTGDVAFEALRRVLPGGEVVGVDFTPEMVELARAKVARLHDSWLQVPGESELAVRAIRFEVGDVLALAYPDSSFDAATIAFGIRNVDDPSLGLREMARVVRPGGAVLILESGMPPNAAFRALYRLYQSSALWVIGGLLSGNIGAYRYLADTTRRFPSGKAFESLMRETKVFSQIDTVPVIGGVAWIYRGTVA